MKKSKLLFCASALLLICNFSFSQKKGVTSIAPLGNVTASFTAPDTVCVNSPVQITNTSSGAVSYFWSFCESNFNAGPSAQNMGNPGNQLSLPVFLDIVQDGSGNYFVFAINNTPSQIVRMNFGNSLLNTPVVDNIGNPGNVLPSNAEGIKVVNVNGDWVAIVVGGDPASGNIPSVAKIDLGTSLTSTTYTTTNWGNIGGLSYPHGLYLFNSANSWYGYAVNARDNSITLLNFGPNFSTVPTGINLGNIGNLNIPTGIGAIYNGGNAYLFITNSGNATITRLDFGTSLLNTPTGVNIGNPGNSIDNPRDISFIQLCNNLEAFVVNGTSNTISQLNFGTNLLGIPTGTNLGNLGNLSFPHSISSLFRVNSDVYAFIPNVNTNSITELKFAGCSTPGSTLQNPGNVTYQQPGIYNINLLTDIGLPTQSSYCKQIVVKDCPLQTCSDWLFLPSTPSYVNIGNLNVPGNQITVEAMINLTSPFTGGPTIGSDVVTKYSDPSDVNYLLRADNASITTNNGFFKTPDFCALDTNKTYHIAMVYDGTALKFYRNGYLMSQIPASGNLFQNGWQTWIGYYQAGFYNTNFIGFINEVRIWNIARTQTQIQTYMNTPLPSPTTQAGLLAYYQFNDLTNKQGNPAWNGTLGGGASINQNNPTCQTFVADSCCPQLKGTFTGDTLCAGGTAHLTFNGLNGIPPYTLIYTDGSQIFTQGSVQNNIPFTIATQPTINTTYGLISIQDASTCGPTNVEGITPNGYIPIIKASVVVNPLPSAQFSGEEICVGSPGTLLFTATAGTAPFSIKYGNGTSTFQLQNLGADTVFNLPYLLADTTRFTLLTVTDSNGCVSNIPSTAEIQVDPLPQGGITGSTVCSGDSATITFTASVGIAPFSLVISDGFIQSTYSNIQSGTAFKIPSPASTTTMHLISITDRNGSGCIRSNNFSAPAAQIIVKPSPQLQFDTLTSTCLKTPPFMLTQAKETSGINGSGAYSGAGVDPNGLFSPSLAGTGSHVITYTYIASDGCSDSLSQAIQVNANPTASAGQSLIACMNTGLQLHATGGVIYSWTPTAGLSDPNIANPVVTISNTTTYTVTVTDANGCSSVDSLLITVSPAGKALYVVPNAFTPNGDGVNDCFGIKRWENVTLEQFTIYNRWGQLVFATQNPSDCWDGTYKGVKQGSGTYVYIIRAHTPCGDVNLKGTVILIR